MLTKIFIVAFTLLGGFRILHFAKNRIHSSIGLKHHLSYILPSLELFSWIVFFIWVARLIYKSGNYFTIISIGVVLVLLSVPLFILLRDFIFGIFLKFQNKVNEGSFIEIEEIKGQIKKAGYLRLDIEDNHGNLNSITYNSIRSKIISHYGMNPHLEKVVLEFSFPDTIKLNQIIPWLKIQVMNTPWVAVSQAPIIEDVKTENSKLKIKVGAYTLNKSYVENIKNLVEAHITNLN